MPGLCDESHRGMGHRCPGPLLIAIMGCLWDCSLRLSPSRALRCRFTTRMHHRSPEVQGQLGVGCCVAIGWLPLPRVNSSQLPTARSCQSHNRERFDHSSITSNKLGVVSDGNACLYSSDRCIVSLVLPKATCTSTSRIAPLCLCLRNRYFVPLCGSRDIIGLA